MFINIDMIFIYINLMNADKKLNIIMFQDQQDIILRKCARFHMPAYSIIES